MINIGALYQHNHPYYGDKEDMMPRRLTREEYWGAIQHYFHTHEFSGYLKIGEQCIPISVKYNQKWEPDTRKPYMIMFYDPSKKKIPVKDMTSREVKYG